MTIKRSHTSLAYYAVGQKAKDGCASSHNVACSRVHLTNGQSQSKVIRLCSEYPIETSLPDIEWPCEDESEYNCHHKHSCLGNENASHETPGDGRQIKDGQVLEQQGGERQLADQLTNSSSISGRNDLEEAEQVADEYDSEGLGNGWEQVAHRGPAREVTATARVGTGCRS